MRSYWLAAEGYRLFEIPKRSWIIVVEPNSLCLFKLAIEDIGRLCLVTGRLMGLILIDGIGRDQSPLLHDAPDATSGYDEALLPEFDLDLSGTVGFAILRV